MLKVTKEQLNTEFANKIWRKYNEGTSAGVKMTPSKLIDPIAAEILAKIVTFGLSLLK